MAGCSTCGSGTGCGCNDTALTTVPTVPLPNCVTPEPCSELISSDCVTYAGASTGLPCGILNGERLTSVIEKMLLCAGGGSGWALNGNTVGVTSTIGTIDNFPFPIIVNSIQRMIIEVNGAIGTTVYPYLVAPTVTPDTFWFEEDGVNDVYLARMNSLGIVKRVQLT